MKYSSVGRLHSLNGAFDIMRGTEKASPHPAQLFHNRESPSDWNSPIDNNINSEGSGKAMDARCVASPVQNVLRPALGKKKREEKNILPHCLWGGGISKSRAVAGGLQSGNVSRGAGAEALRGHLGEEAAGVCLQSHCGRAAGKVGQQNTSFFPSSSRRRKVVPLLPDGHSGILSHSSG